MKIRDVAGLRPGRSQVKLETEHRGGGKTTIIHNIGYENLISNITSWHYEYFIKTIKLYVKIQKIYISEGTIENLTVGEIKE